MKFIRSFLSRSFSRRFLLINPNNHDQAQAYTATHLCVHTIVIGLFWAQARVGNDVKGVRRVKKKGKVFPVGWSWVSVRVEYEEKSLSNSGRLDKTSVRQENWAQGAPLRLLQTQRVLIYASRIDVYLLSG